MRFKAIAYQIPDWVFETFSFAKDQHVEDFDFLLYSRIIDSVGNPEAFDFLDSGLDVDALDDRMELTISIPYFRSLPLLTRIDQTIVLTRTDRGVPGRRHAVGKCVQADGS